MFDESVMEKCKGKNKRGIQKADGNNVVFDESVMAKQRWDKKDVMEVI